MNRTTPAVALQPNRKPLKLKLKRQKWLLLMLLPAFLCVLFFNYLPLSGWYIAFSEYKLNDSLFAGEFVGLKYFKKIFLDSSDFVYLIRNTLAMNGATVVVNITLALTLAILLQEIRWKRCAKLVQSITFFPYFVSWVIIYAIVGALFSVNSGAINQFMVNNGILSCVLLIA